jgi:hypothetical protein
MEPGCEWHGTAREWDDLALAVDRNCDCVWNGMGGLVSVCVAHRWLEDQHGLDRLVFARRIANRLRVGEFSTGPRAQEVTWR